MTDQQMMDLFETQSSINRYAGEMMVALQGMNNTLKDMMDLQEKRIEKLENLNELYEEVNK